MNMKNISINVKLSYTFILLIVALIVISNFILYFIFNSIFKKQIVQDLTNVMTQNSWNVDTFINSINQASLYLCADKSVATVLSTEFTDQVGIASAVNNLRSEYNTHIAIPLNDVIVNNYASTFFVDTALPFSRYLQSTYSFDSTGLFNASGVSSEPWYQAAYRTQGEMNTFVQNGNKQRLFLARSVSSPYLVNSNYKNGFMGVAVFNFDVAQIGDKIKTGELTPSTMVFLTDGDGTILYSKNDKDLQTSIAKYLPLSLLKNYASTNTLSLRQGDRSGIASINALKYGWYLIALIPEQDIAARMASIWKVILLTSALAICFGVVFSIIFSKSITQPIIRLASAMKGVKDQEYLDISLEPPSQDEVGLLYGSFNAMMRRINSLIEKVKTSSKIQKQAELKALQAQINPHFLYNTLDTIGWLSLCSGNAEVASITSSLAKIMRFNLKDPETLVTIAEELEHVKNYIEIQSLRYSGNFEIEYSINPQILQKKAPKLTLQPLVENSIIHGTETTERKGLISITGYIDNDKMIIRIADNGCSGADERNLNGYLNGEPLPFKKSDGIGIRNVNERIKLHFGADYGLHYEANKPAGIIAIITLPYRATY